MVGHSPTLINKSRAVILFIGLLGSHCLHAQGGAEELKKLSLEELMDVEVLSVSRRPEKLSETASAIQVITGESINRYGASNLPEALYLAGNLQVAQRNAHSWSISARGFNTELGNKLLVLMDGRTVYTPLFSGVFWARQNYLLEDISRIEVISGPGGTLWGANAVNGVINILSKSADETQGLYVKGAIGNELEAQGAIRYGGKLAEHVYFRVYGQYSQRDGMVFSDSIDAPDDWKMGQGGFRIDAKPSLRTQVTLQGDLYTIDSAMPGGGNSGTTGGNVLGRWSHTFADSSSVSFQAYYDRTTFDQPTPAMVIDGNEIAPAGTFKDDLATFDMDFQHRFMLGPANRLVWGLGYRFMHDQLTNSPGLGFLPEEFKQDLFSVFLQDEMEVLKNFYLILGTKLEHNDYTGFVWEPNGRLRWNLAENQVLWAAVSRAVRIPSRVDRDMVQASPPHFLFLTGSPDFQNETVIAYEAGFRSHIADKGSASVSLFYNQYDDIRSTVTHPENILPLSFANGLEGETYGAEATLKYQIADWWRLSANYLWQRNDIRVKDGETDLNNGFNETADPGWQLGLRSTFNLPFGIRINPAFRWVDKLLIDQDGAQVEVPSYAELDGSIAWLATDDLEIAVAGRNLLHKSHVEYGIPDQLQVAIQRSIYVRATWKLD